MNTPKILFATMPMDGHFNPLTGLAVHLKQQGYDVRWYTGGDYADKAERIGIPTYRFQQAQVINQDNLEELFPERAAIKGAIGKISFDIKHVFVLPITNYMADLTAIRKEFAFDMMVSDVGFSAMQVVKHVFNVPVVGMGIMPIPQTSRDLPPNGLGLTPDKSVLGRLKQSILRFVTNQLMKGPTQTYNEVVGQFGVEPQQDSIFDIAVRIPDVYLQSGTPSFEYERSDLSLNVRFVGPLLPYASGAKRTFAYPAKLNQYKKVILVTQGTIERDAEKLLVPTLEAYKDTDTLVIVTTGGSGTAALRARYPQANIVIEDFIDFNTIMPKVDVFVTNGGYGGVLLSVQNRLPMVVAGVHEGKNEIAARIGYFKLGVNLKTETPKPAQIRKAVEEVLKHNQYKRNVTQLSQEFSEYHPNELCEQYINNLLMEQGKTALLDAVA
ncbi:glycosyltransferase [Spirosoma knui]